MSSTPVPTVLRSSKFWSDKKDYPIFQSDIQVNDTLYKLDPNAIFRSSAYLEDLCNTPGPDNTPQQSSETAPICLINVDKSEFEIFISVAYGRPPTLEQWPRGSQAMPLLLRVLELGRYFISPATKELAFGVIKTRSYFLSPAKLINISLTYGSRFLFDAAFKRLICCVFGISQPRMWT
ncbi:hypothetical protein B0H12DRAFT_1246916 [Mycena haematopus]|nr:hypothetical protein B0H12DRAFT_1246916 [Mycena haematopus]